MTLEAAEANAIEIPGYSGRGVSVKAGTRVRITDIEGAQIADLFALVQSDPAEHLCAARTRLTCGRLFPVVGQQFVTDKYRPILTFISDQSPGVHDSLYATCDPGLHEALGGGASHANCHDNYLTATKTVGLETAWVPAPINLFQSTPVHPDGSLGAEKAPTKPGDNVVLQAEMDLYLIVTACSVDEIDINGGISTPIRLEILEDKGQDQTCHS